jgi:hypothetical protein
MKITNSSLKHKMHIALTEECPCKKCKNGFAPEKMAQAEAAAENMVKRAQMGDLEAIRAINELLLRRADRIQAIKERN